MEIESLLRRNEAFLNGNVQAVRLPSPIALLTCIDCRLNDYLGPAFGIAREDILLIRNAGNVVPDQSGDPLRSLAMAIYLKGATEVLVLGHTDCRMSQFEASPFLDSLTRWGVGRQQLGPVDLRRWAGAFHDPRQNVRHAADIIARCPFIPRQVPVHGMLIDTATGKLELLIDGNLELGKRALGVSAASLGRRPAESVAPIQEAAEIPPSLSVSREEEKPVKPAAPPKSGAAPTVPPTPVVKPPPPPPPPPPAAGAASPRPPQDLMGALKVLRNFYAEVRQKPEYRVELEQVRAEIRRREDPVESYMVLENALLRLAANRPDVIAALRIVRDQIARSPIGNYVQSLLHQILKV